MKGKKKLAVAVTAISIAGLGGGTAASAAQAQNEVLPTTTTFWGGGSGVCIGTASASVSFSASGAVTAGPYPGLFTETVRVGFSRRVYWQAGKLTISSTSTLSIPFTITSGSTTITGTVTNPAGSGVGITDCVNYYPGGLFVSASNATYTATIQTQGQTAKTTVTGTAQVSGLFALRPPVKGTPLSVTLLNFPSPTS
jgi:hypothetical protein